MCEHRRRQYEAILTGTALASLSVTRLLSVERTFEGAIPLPAQAEVAESYFRLYRMRSSVSYMANRLGRLAVAVEGAHSAQRVAAGEESVA